LRSLEEADKAHRAATEKATADAAARRDADATELAKRASQLAEMQAANASLEGRLRAALDDRAAADRQLEHRVRQTEAVAADAVARRDADLAEMRRQAALVAELSAARAAAERDAAECRARAKYDIEVRPTRHVTLLSRLPRLTCPSSLLLIHPGCHPGP
jgi:hypothetical protein